MSQLRQPRDYFKTIEWYHHAFTRSQRNPMRIENKPLTDSCPRAMRENSWKQQPRKLRLDMKRTTHIPRTTANRRKYTKKGMSTENNIGVQTRAMAQWVDNEANPEQVQKTTTPMVKLHRTKEDNIKEFI